MTGQSAVRQLRKSRTSRVIDGVCGGLGDYLGIDPVIVRVVFAVSVLFGGLGVILYIALMIIMPAEVLKAPEPAPEPVVQGGRKGRARSRKTEPEKEAAAPVEAVAPAPGTKGRNGMGAAIGGVLLIVLGILLLLRNVGFGLWHFWWGAPWDLTMSLLLIAAGVAFLVTRRGDAAAQESGRAESPFQTSRLTRPRHGRKLFGVCAGLAEYVNVDPTVVRILFVIAALASIGFMVLLYVLLSIVVPSDARQPVQAMA